MVRGGAETLPGMPVHARSLFTFATSADTHTRLREDYALLRDLGQGKAKERFGPIIERLAKAAYFEQNEEVATTIRMHGRMEEVVAAE